MKIKLLSENIGPVGMHHSMAWYDMTSGLILGLHAANGRRRYFVTTSLIGWAQTYNQPCDIVCIAAMTARRLHINHDPTKVTQYLLPHPRASYVMSIVVIAETAGQVIVEPSCHLYKTQLEATRIACVLRITPRHPHHHLMITHMIDSYQIQTQNKTKSVTNCL